MAARNAAKPRPNKNSDGQDKQPSMTHTIHIDPAKPQPAPAPPPRPGAPAPGSTNPMTHPMHPQMQSSLGTSSAPNPNEPQKTTATFPEQGNANPTGNPLGQITPTPSTDQRQVREQIQYKDLNPAEQSQVASQQGLDPYAPLKMVQQGVTGALQEGASSSPIPNMLAGPYVPPGVESFPDDMAHLTTLMGQGFAPGASPQEHEFAQNAHAMANARIQQAMSQGQQGAGSPTPTPLAPAQPGGPQGVTYAPGIPEGQSGPAPVPSGAPGGLPSSLGSPTPTGPPPGGAIPPALIAALLAKHKQNQPVR